MTNGKNSIDDVPLDEIKKIDVNWDDLILPHSIKENLEFSILSPEQAIGTPNEFGVILFGLPGVGKTTIPFSIAKKLNWKLFYISPKNFITKERNPEFAIKSSFKAIERKYEKTKKAVEKWEADGKKGKKPSANMVFVFDEIDELVTSRNSESGKDSRLLTTLMLPLFNDLRKDAEKYNFIFFALTNYIGRFDTAITRKGRFDIILPIGLPNRAGRYLWFEKQIEKLKQDYAKKGFRIYDSHNVSKKEIIPDLKKKGGFTIKNIVLEVPDVDFNIISRTSDGLSFGDIESICKRVVESLVAEAGGVKDFMKKPLRYKVNNPVTIRLGTDKFFAWINRLRQLGRINYEDLKKFNEDSLLHSRGSSSTELNLLVGDLIKEIESIDIRHVYKCNPNNISIKIRNLSEFSSFDIDTASVSIKGLSNKIEIHELHFDRSYLYDGDASEELLIPVKTKNKKKIELEYHLSGIFTLKGVSGTLGNSADLHTDIVKKKRLEINQS